jgi:galactonate dehydratase
VTTNAILQFVAATENVAITEYPDPYKASTADNLLNTGVKLRQVDMVTQIPEFKAGYLIVPEEPGIGNEWSDHMMETAEKVVID